MSGFLPRADKAFACYPPIYQLLLGTWYSAFGFSLTTTLAFSYLVHLANSLAMMLVTIRFLVLVPNLSLSARKMVIVAIGLIHFGNLAYFDRPEELALLWIWLELLTACGSRKRLGIATYLVSGMFVGLAALTSPWVGVLGGLAVTIRTILSTEGELSSSRVRCITRKIYQLGCTVFVAVGMVAIWYVAIEANHPGIIDDQFFGTLHYLRNTQPEMQPVARLIRFAKTALFNAPQLPATGLAIVFFPMVIVGKRWKLDGSLAVTVYLTALIGILIVAFLRPDAYTYLGAAQILLLPCWGPAVGRFLVKTNNSISAGIGIVVVLVCAFFASQDAARFGIYSFRLPPSERSDNVFDALRSRISPGDPVAVTPRHWYVFQGRNPWREAFFSSRLTTEEVLKCRWLVLYPGVGIPKWINDFELVEGVSSGFDEEGTYAYSLWRRKGK